MSFTLLFAVFGHVDHGKSSFIETACDISIKEQGNITQGVRPFSCMTDDKKVFLLDTPGHAIFNDMKNDACNVIDFALLIIDILKGIEQETVECISMFRQKGLPFVKNKNYSGFPN